MFELYFGPYLVEKDILTSANLESILKQLEATRSKLGFLAIAENLITKEQADELNLLQTTKDMRFGDLAIEKGYLTEAQLSHLLSLQGNTYFKFIQLLVEKNLLSYEKINTMLSLYASEKKLSNDDISALKSDDVDHIIQTFAKVNEPLMNELINLILRNVIRFINNQMTVVSISKYSSYTFNHMASQILEGDHHILVGFTSKDNELLQIASPFAKEEFSAVDEDSLDSVCEFINCCNGLFASKKSIEGVRINMLPPLFYADQQVISNKENIYVVTININNETCDLVVVSDSDYSIK